MTYTHLTMKELSWIETFYEQGMKAYIIAKKLGRAMQTIYNVTNYFKEGGTIIDYYDRYLENKSRCGAKKKSFTQEEVDYIKEKVQDGWTPDVIIGRNERNLNVCAKTLYHRFKDSDLFDEQTLPMKGERKPNHHQETRGQLNDRRNLDDRAESYPDYHHEFGHFEGDTIVGKHHQSAVITLVERISKLIVAIQTPGRKALDIQQAISNWLAALPHALVKSITLDNGKEFAAWKALCNEHDIAIFFADPGCPSQRGLNEHANGQLRRDGLTKGMDFTDLDQGFLSAVAMRRNIIPRKSLGYYSPIEVFLSHVFHQPPDHFTHIQRAMMSQCSE